MRQHIAVLMGGWSAEREVSLSSGAACMQALKELGYCVTPIDVTPDVASLLDDLKPDVVFNALHGRWGEDGCVQGILEILNIPYTHSGVLASSLAMDKPMAKQVFRSLDIPTPDGVVIRANALLKGEPIARPYVIKPVNEGSSVGVVLVFEQDNRSMAQIVEAVGGADAELLIEPYIPGREVQVAVLNNQALGAIEIRPISGFYDYEAKYTDGKAEHLMPAPIHADAYELACKLAVKAHIGLGCRGLTRADFRYDDTQGEPGDLPNNLRLLEINTQPGMTPLSLSPEIAAHAGISFNQLVDMLVSAATTDSRRGQTDGTTHQTTTAITQGISG